MDLFDFEFPMNLKKNLKDVKEFVKDEYIKKCNPICPCFLKIYKQDDEDKKKNVLSNNDKYKDDTLLDDTIFNEKYIIYICIPKERKCTCGKLEYYYDKAYEHKKNNDEKDKIRKDYQEELSKQKRELTNAKKEIENKLNGKIEKLSNTLNFYIKKENDEIERKNSANLKFLKENGNVIKQFYKEKFEYIKFELLEKIQNYMNEKISFKEIDISKIIQQEKFSQNIKIFLENEIKNSDDSEIISKISHFNILVMGDTGAGKSTLLNKVLKAKLAKTCFGNACTQEIESYESSYVKGLRIYDTRGIETGKYNDNDN